MTIQTLNNNVTYGEQRTKINANFADLDTRVDGAQSTADAKYSKPGTGIPKTDLASAVQTSLGKADTALQDGNAFATAAQGAKADTAYQKPANGIPESDLAAPESIDITSNVTINSTNLNTYQGKNLIFTGAYTVTIAAADLKLRVFCKPPATGAATFAVNTSVNTLSLNGATTSVEKTAADCKVFSVFDMAGDDYFVVGETIDSGGGGSVTLPPNGVEIAAIDANKNVIDSSGVLFENDVTVVNIAADVTITSSNISTYKNKKWNITAGGVNITLSGVNFKLGEILVRLPAAGTTTFKVASSATLNGATTDIGVVRSTSQRLVSLTSFADGDHELTGI